MKVLVAAAALALLGSSGCAKKPVPAAVTSTSDVVGTSTGLANAMTGLANANANANDAPVAVHERRPRHGDGSVYVDGILVGALKVKELPAALKPAHSYVQAGTVVADFGLLSYVSSLGIDASRVKGLQIHAGRVLVISGDDFRKGADRTLISFSAGDRGKPRIDIARGVKSNTSIDTVGSLAIYVDKEPPALKPNDNRNLFFADGTPVTGVAYAPAEQGSGTRIYVDGKLTSVVKRKALSNDLLANDDLAKPRFSLTAFFAQAGIDAKKAKAVDFVSNDEVVARVNRLADKKITFAVPARNQGLAMVELEEGRDVKVSAVQVFMKKTPPARAIKGIEPNNSASGNNSARDGR